MTGWLGRLPRGLVALCLVLVWFNAGSEDIRTGELAELGELRDQPWKIAVPPWRLLRAYASRDSDEKLYWEYSRLVLGEQPEARDLDYLAMKRQGDLEANRAAIAAEIRPGSAIRLPYRDFAFEYPPLPIAAMIVPRLFVDSLPAYRLAYGDQAALLTLVTCWLAAQLVRDRSARNDTSGAPAQPWTRMAWLVLAIGPLVISRFDILPALLVTAGLVLLRRDRAAAAGACFAAGALTKLYPLLLLFVLVMPLWLEGQELTVRQAKRLIAGAVVAGAALSAPFLAIAPGPFLHSTLIYGGRPFQVESVIGALALLVRGKDFVVGSFGSYNVATAAWLEALASLMLPAAVLGCAGLAIWQARRQPSRSPAERSERQLRWTLATLGCVLATSKVLSPQFLIWLVPLAALTGDRAARRWYLASAALTQVFYPFLYSLVIHEANRLVVAVVVLRNAALIAGTAYAVRHALQATWSPYFIRAPSPSPSADPSLR